MTVARRYDAILPKLSPLKLHLLIGEITSLLMLSNTHRQYQIRDIADIILPPINLNQYKLYRDAQKRPVALVTWGWLSEAVEQRYLAGDMLLTPADLQSGERLWFTDFIAPYGHMKQVAQHVKTSLFPNHCAKSMRLPEDKTASPRILKFYGVNYRKKVN
jgi:cytolysin-activating lysine-acyltransferase